ncbi:MAG: redox-regulated ATPase YchF [bacterium]|nr:redox-regulated ATPase YchF [bacterium]
MSLSIGIVGLPNVGKSTLFNALTKKSVPAENYPFCTIDPSVGIVAVPDERLWKLSEFSKSGKTLPAVVEFVDIAGLVKGASEGEGLGNKFLANIRETDAILEVVRIFEDSNVIHIANEINPKNDIEIINTELILADLQTVTNRLQNISHDVKRGDKQAVIEAGALERMKKSLNDGSFAQVSLLDEKEKPLIKQLNLLTNKPIIYGLNKKTGAKNLDELNDTRFQELWRYIAMLGSQYIIIDAKIEEDVKDFTDEERKELLGNETSKSGVDELIKKSYEVLGLMTYFTTGEDETRGWTIKNGSTAREAGAAIHTDFRDKFIRAEVIFWQDLLKAGSYGVAREKGLVRTEGKEYIVRDGDVIEFKI